MRESKRHRKTSAAGPTDEGSLTVALAGNPNCGKSALFNAFTGIRQRTGNWPGVTVERKEGRFKLDQHPVVAIDLPGIYSLDASSLDEMVTRNFLLERSADLVLNVVDAANLERNLYLTVQLLEMGVPLVVALNMMDVARKRGIQIQCNQLSEALGCPVVPVVAVTGEGISQLKASMLEVVGGQVSGGFSLAYDEVIEQAVAQLVPQLPAVPEPNRRWQSIKLLEDESPDAALAADPGLGQAVARLKQQIADRTGEDADILIADSRFGHAHALTHRVISIQGKLDRSLTDRLDRLVLGRWTGIPLFLTVMYLMFLFTVDVGGAFIDFFDQAATALFVNGFGELLTGLGAPDWLKVILADGVGNGISVVATFIPIITALYLFLSVLEDSGYMARAAFVMDRFMRAIGLPGKAFVPLIVGFGCNVPAIMATRTLENERERKLTILMNPFMSCGARLPVYVLFAAAFFPESGQNIVFALYLTGIAVAILTGVLMRHTLLPGETSGFMMELPPYHLPTLKGLMLRAWDRVRLFIKEAGRVIVLMVLGLNLLNSVGTDGSFGNDNTNRSILSAASRELTPLFAPMGIEQDNWPAVVGVFSGILAKEVVVGTLDNLYTQLSDENRPSEAEVYQLWPALQSAAETVPANLAALGGKLLDPLGIGVGDLADHDAVAAEHEISQGTFGAMIQRFDGQAGAFAYLLFILLYFPCVATIGAIKREAGPAWAAFVAAWTTIVAYVTAVGFYQIATFGQHSHSSLLWLLGLTATFVLLILGLRFWARGRLAATGQTVRI